jgi:perosamine synthetase
MANGSTVAAFEKAFAQYVGAKYAIALCNGTATLHTALVALGVQTGDNVAVPPLTMSATTMAVLQAGAVPVFCDVDPDTWLMAPMRPGRSIAVSLYGLTAPFGPMADVDDAAQTLRKHGNALFTSYSFQASKILALGEGGMLVTDHKGLATIAREFSSLGYRMRPDQPRIDPAVLKDPKYERHHSMGWNYRMNDATAALAVYDDREGLPLPQRMDKARWVRQQAATLYREAIAGCAWITPQFVPEGWTHDYWSYAAALESADLWHPFVDAVVRHGGERPYAAWRLTYQEPAFRHLAADGCCPVAESLQPRLVQFQTNNLASAEKNAEAARHAIREIGG